MTYLLLGVATLLTSIVSGVLSMAGGMILMAVFSVVLSVPTAMVLHGFAQAASNGTRIWLYRSHIIWSILLPYSIGAALCVAAFISITFVPNKGIVLIAVGSLPFLSFVLPKHLNLNIQHRFTAIACGILVTAAQLLAGASGPLLDLFYNQTDLSRHQVLASKAVTQTLGHILKLIYYAFFIGIGLDLPLWVLVFVVVMAVAGNKLASYLVARISDARFRNMGRWVILVIGFLCIVEGIRELI